MNTLIRSVCLGAVGLLTALGITTTAVGQELPSAEPAESHLDIMVASDIHVLADSLHVTEDGKPTEDFQRAIDGDRKMMPESEEIFERYIDQVIAKKPDVLLISGDLTKDGEIASHTEVVAQLDRAKKAVPNLQIHVTNGNHDINNSKFSRDFSKQPATQAPFATPDDYARLYDAYLNQESVVAHYPLPEGASAGRFSYTAQLAPGYTLVVLDGGRYTADNTKSGVAEHETNGNFTEELLTWAEAQISAAQQRGDVIIGMTHWGINEHFSYQPTFMSPYLVDNYSAVQERLSNAGMDYIFTGHMHANDISVINGDGGNRLVDIETGSLVTYPSPTRSVTVSRVLPEPIVEPGSTATSAAVQAVTTVDITSQYGEIPNLSFTENLTEYGMSATGFDPSFLRNVVPELIEPYVQSIRDAGGIVPFLEQNWVDGLGLQAMLGGFLPAAIDAPTFDAFKTNVLVPKVAELIESAKSEVPGALGTINSGAAISVVNEALAALDRILEPGANGNSVVTNLIADAAVQLADTVITADGHKLIDLATYGYQTHLRGDENPADRPAWVNEVYAKLDSGALVTELVTQLINNSYDTLIRPLAGVVDTARLTNVDGYKTGWLIGGKTMPVDASVPPLLSIGALAGPVISGKLFDSNAEKGYKTWKPELANLGGVMDLLQNGIDVPVVGRTQIDVRQKITTMLHGLVIGTPADAPAEEAAAMNDGSAAEPDAPKANADASDNASSDAQPVAFQMSMTSAQNVATDAATGLLTPELNEQASTMLRGLLDSLTTDENNSPDGAVTFTTTDQVMRAVTPATPESTVDATEPVSSPAPTATPDATASEPGMTETVAPSDDLEATTQPAAEPTPRRHDPSRHDPSRASTGRVVTAGDTIHTVAGIWERQAR